MYKGLGKCTFCCYFLCDMPLKQAWVPPLYPWIYSSFQASVIWERQGGGARCLVPVMPFDWEWNSLHILPTGLSVPGIFHHNRPFYSSLFCGLWMRSMSYHCFRGSKRVTEKKALDLKDLPACNLSSVLQFPLLLREPSSLICWFSEGSTLASVHIFRWVCWSWQRLLYPDSPI